MKPAHRLEGLALSPIRQFAEGAPPDSVPLGVGEPTWPMPQPAVEILQQFSGACPYGPGGGIPELRQAVASFYRAESNDVMIASGSQGALFSLLQAWIDPGDVVLVPDPGFVTYRLQARFAGGVPLAYPLSPENHFHLDAHAVVALLEQPRVRAIILNHPANPTGAAASLEALTEIAAVCRKRDVLLISDEVYRDLYLGERPAGLREASAYGVVVSSVSKAWGAPGLRVGWAVGDRRWLDPARTVHAYAVTSAAYPNQLAAVALLERSAAIHCAARRELHRRWIALAEALAAHMKITASPPDGAFYCWLPLPAAALEDPWTSCLKMRDEARVIFVPGIVFGEGGRAYIRLSFAARPEQIADGIRRLAPFWRRCGSRS